MAFDFNRFGIKVFNDKVMRQTLPAEVYNVLQKSIKEGTTLDPSIASDVAKAMKEWACKLGCTHYNHWFSPMTNINAGKHDGFLTLSDDNSVILEFSGKELIKGEPDASSFPSGGLRNTFEARGYTAWDCTSPAFVKDNTLYIPTAFCSYTGEALDMKTPVLRATDVVKTHALRILKLFGNKTSKYIIPTVGAEQEYFLIDRKLYEQRLDLKVCGRTLFGAKPPKGQEMDDHYFGRIRIRVSEFMQELDQTLWELGISSKTKHNEVAPAQHELAPIFEICNVACDHNQLTMEVMRTVAKKKGLACLLHEKPFAGVNGSGKHNNWSLSTDDGINLFDPGKTPYENIQFLVFLCAVIMAVDKHSDLLRMSAAVIGNDFRLGSSEAPPAIISIFLGEHLTSILYDIAHGNSPSKQTDSTLEIGVKTLPQLKKDDSDRNRTSPFAFTGNKFEFRMVGSSDSIAASNWILNTIVGESLNILANRLEKANDIDKEITAIIKDTVNEHGKIIFNGNNYTEEWVEEAKRRELPNLCNTVDATKVLIDPKNVKLMSAYNVLSEAEMFSRYEIKLENFVKTVTIEAATMLQMTRRQILPCAISYIGEVTYSYNQLCKAGINNETIKNYIKELSDLISNIQVISEKLDKLIHETDEDIYKQAVYCRDILRQHMDELRVNVDMIETIISDKKWPMPNYTDLLYRV